MLTNTKIKSNSHYESQKPRSKNRRMQIDREVIEIESDLSSGEKPQPKK